jgi:tetratricopeptide (TPR) repeat protein
MFLSLILIAYFSCSPKINQDASTISVPNPANLCGPTKAELDTKPGKDGKLAPLFDGLDVYSYPITTKSELAQKYFDQGFILQYGFNHAEASRSFREAIRQDPDCAMCYWGLAYVIGPNYNAPMDPEVIGTANEAINNAMLKMHNATPKEQALINALTKRYPKDKEADPAPFYKAYAESMREVNKAYPQDIDINVMTAEALLDLHPWDLFTQDKEAQPWTQEILDLLEEALAKDPMHPQACHLYIHSVEAGPNPEIGKVYADNLRLRVPGAGHLLHMPSHLYINIGEYHQGTIANEKAVIKDSLYVAACHMAGIYPLGYYPHNWHFLAACTGLEGNGTRALEASKYMADYVVDEQYLRFPGFGSLQHFLTIPWFIEVKFSKWDEILDEEAPAADLRYPKGIWAYAQGMAKTAKYDFAGANEDLDTLRMIMAEVEMEELIISVNNTAKQILNIAENMLQAEMALQKGDINTALSYFKKGAKYEDQLKYIEPPDWFFSVRHHLGDALLRAGRFVEAENVYLKDLEKYKENGWALNGLRIALEMQGKVAESVKIAKRFEKAWAHADIVLRSSII